MARPVHLFAVSKFLDEEGPALEAIAKKHNCTIVPIRADGLDPEKGGKLGDGELEKIEISLISEELLNAEQPWYHKGLAQPFFATSMKAPNLKWLCVSFVGLDGPIFDNFRKKGARITNMPGITAIPISQTAMAGILMMARGFLHYIQSKSEKKWTPYSQNKMNLAPRRSLSSTTAVVLGIGGIGSELARQLKFYGVHVIGVRRSKPKGDEPADEMATLDDLPRLAPRADWLICALPSSGDTAGVISKEVLAALPPNACFVNVSRGGIVDETALIDALKSGKVMGAYLDVATKEPLPKESELWDLPNVIISPHDSWAEDGTKDRGRAMFRRYFEQYVSGATMDNEETQAPFSDPNKNPRAAAL